MRLEMTDEAAAVRQTHLLADLADGVDHLGHDVGGDIGLLFE